MYRFVNSTTVSTCITYILEDWLIDWLYIVFYAVSAIFRPYNGGIAEGYGVKDIVEGYGVKDIDAIFNILRQLFRNC